MSSSGGPAPASGAGDSSGPGVELTEDDLRQVQQHHEQRLRRQQRQLEQQQQWRQGPPGGLRNSVDAETQRGEALSALSIAATVGALFKQFEKWDLAPELPDPQRWPFCHIQVGGRAFRVHVVDVWPERESPYGFPVRLKPLNVSQGAVEMGNFEDGDVQGVIFACVDREVLRKVAANDPPQGLLLGFYWFWGAALRKLRFFNRQSSRGAEAILLDLPQLPTPARTGTLASSCYIPVVPHAPGATA